MDIKPILQKINELSENPIKFSVARLLLHYQLKVRKSCPSRHLLFKSQQSKNQNNILNLFSRHLLVKSQQSKNQNNT